MLRKVAVLGAMALVAIVLAQGLALIGAYGQGAAVSEDQRVAGFRFNVSKLTSEPPQLNGDFAVQIGGHNHRSVNIVLRNLRNVAIGGEHRNVCEFGGPAVMRVRTPRGIETVEGALAVRVVDSRQPQGDADGGEDLVHPDHIQLTFHNPTHHVRYTFAGRVRHGDIVVFVRPH